MKKILFVDTWTQGKNFIKPLVQNFIENNIKCIYLHADSFYLNEIDNNIKPIVDLTYEDYDISEYDNSILKAYEDLKPDAIITISVHGLFQRWANHVAEKLNIPCFFFMHGIRLKDPPKNKSSLKYALNRVVYYSKQFNLFTRDYVRLNSFSINSVVFLLNYYKELIVFNYRYSNNPKINIGFAYKIMFVNINSDIKYFKESYPLSENTEFCLSGNVSALEPAIKSLNIKNKRNQITFISQPSIIPINEYLGFIERLNNLFIDTKFNFVFRPHPRDQKKLIEILKSKEIMISENNAEVDFSKSLVAVGVNSAMLLGFMKLNIPILQIVDGVNMSICDLNKYENSFNLEINFLDSKNASIINFIENSLKNFSLCNDYLSPTAIISKKIISKFQKK